MSGQPKIHSFVEVSINVFLGWALSVWVGQLLVYPMFDIELTLAGNMGATAIFTFISMAKNYVIRRTADWYQHRRKD